MQIYSMLLAQYRMMRNMKVLLNKNNNAPKRGNNSKDAKKRKGPARGQLVARSMRRDVETKPARKPSPKTRQEMKKKSPPKKSPILKKKPPKKKPTMIKLSPCHLETPLQLLTPSTSNQKPALEKRERKAQQKRDKMLEVVASMDPSPTRYTMMPPKVRTKKSSRSTSRKGKTKSSPQNQKPSTSACLSRRPSFNDVKEWPSLAPQQRKGVVKEAATEIVKNKQGGTVAQLSKQKKVGIAAASSKSKEITHRESTLTEPKGFLRKTWASVVGSFKSERHDSDAAVTEMPSTSLGVSSSEESLRRENKSIKVCGKKSKDNILLTTAGRKQTIEKRRETQKQRAEKNGQLDEECLLLTNEKSTTAGCRYGLRWHIDNMPDNLMCTRPASGTISLQDNKMAETCESNRNKCNNRQLSLGHFLPTLPTKIGIPRFSNDINECRVHERCETDICQMMDDVSFGMNITSQDKGKGQGKHSCKENKKGKLIEDTPTQSTNDKQAETSLESAPPKKVSLRYRALMRRDASRMGTKEMSVQISHDKRVEASLERKTSRRQNAKNMRQERHQRSRNDQQSPEDEDNKVDVDFDANPGTSSQSAHAQNSFVETRFSATTAPLAQHAGQSAGGLCNDDMVVDKHVDEKDDATEKKKTK